MSLRNIYTIILKIVIVFIPRKFAVILASKLKYRFIHDILDPNIKRKKNFFNAKNLYLSKKGVHGEQLVVDVNDHIGYRYFINGFFDDIPFQVCKSLGFKNVFFIDVGANIGSISIPIAFSGAKVIAIEPQLKLIKNLIHNLENNQISNCIAVPVALGNENNILSTLYTQPGNSGAASLQKAWNAGKSNSIDFSVPLYKFDTVVHPFLTNQDYKDKLFIMKIDVEGFEFEVLNGALGFIKEFDPLILFENRPDLNETNDTLDFLKSLNYEILGIKFTSKGSSSSRDTLECMEFDPLLKYENVLAIPKILNHLLTEICLNNSHK